MLNMAVLVSGGGTNLQALLDARARGDMPDARICLVVSDRQGAYALERARSAGVEAVTLERRKGESPESYGDRLTALLKSRDIGFVVLAGFLQILSANVISAYPGRMINVHPSLLPSFGGEGFYGLRVHEAALRRGVKVTGATVHIVNEKVDGGRILLQRAVDVLPGDTPETLQRRVMERAEWIILPMAAQMMARLIEYGGMPGEV